MTNLGAGVTLGGLTGAAVAAGETLITGAASVNLREALGVGVAVCGMVWWLGRKFQRIEDVLEEHRAVLGKLPCATGKEPCDEGKETTMKRKRNVWGGLGLGLLAAGLLVGLSGCATLDRAYQEEVTWTIAPVVTVTTNAVVVTNVVPQVVEQVRVEWMTNAGTGAITSAVVREPVATNLVEVLVTNWVARYETNGMPVRVTNWVARPEVLATIGAAGSVTNTFLPGVGSLAALVLGGLYHGYRQVRNRKVNEALVQGVETARAILTTTPQGQAADAALVKWLMSHQQEAGVFTTIATLVTEVSDNPAAREAAREILARTQRVG